MAEEVIESQIKSDGLIRKYKAGLSYIPVEIWKTIGGDVAGYIRDMKSVLIFDPNIDPEILFHSLELITKFLKKNLKKLEAKKDGID